MPTSFLDNIVPVVQFCINTKPKSVLDVGAGYGKMGHLIREYCDHYPWQMRIDAVEAYDPYLQRIRFGGYDNVYVTDFLDIRDELDGFRYDLVLMVDVLEHFGKLNGIRALNIAREVGVATLVSTPRKPAAQGAEYENEYERHQSVWTEGELEAVGKWHWFSNSVMGVLLPEGMPAP
jgi:cyclopropane fatty-acyl-phospholipid synthase-like methyltransferase